MKRVILSAGETETGTPSAPGDLVAVGRLVEGRVVVGLLRTVSLLALLATLALAAVAGLFVTGDIEMLEMHRRYGEVLSFLVLGQLILAVALWRRNRWLRWPMVAMVVLLGLTALQMAWGDTRVLGGHMPLGVAICGAEAVLVLWSFVLLRPVRATAPAGEAAGEAAE